MANPGAAEDQRCNNAAEGPIRLEGTLQDQSHPHPRGCISPAWIKQRPGLDTSVLLYTLLLSLDVSEQVQTGM